MNKTILAICALILLVSCESEPIIYTYIGMDNPSDEDVTVTIDDSTFVLKSNMIICGFEVLPGNHSFTAKSKSGEELVNMSFNAAFPSHSDDTPQIWLNPSKSTYYFWEKIYGGIEPDDIPTLEEQEFEIAGKKYTARVKSTNEAIISFPEDADGYYARHLGPHKILPKSTPAAEFRTQIILAREEHFQKNFLDLQGDATQAERDAIRDLQLALIKFVDYSKNPLPEYQMDPLLGIEIFTKLLVFEEVLNERSEMDKETAEEIISVVSPYSARIMAGDASMFWSPVNDAMKNYFGLTSGGSVAEWVPYQYVDVEYANILLYEMVDVYEQPEDIRWEETHIIGGEKVGEWKIYNGNWKLINKGSNE